MRNNKNSQFVRKISRAKWNYQNSEGIKKKEIPADVISIDLKTKGNTLSLWKTEDDSTDNINKAVLALVTSNKLDTIDVVWFDKKSFSKKKIVVRPSPGNTPVETLIESHFNACSLDYKRLGKVAKVIQKAIKSGNTKRYRKKEIIDIVKKGIENNLVNKNDLPESFLKKL